MERQLIALGLLTASILPVVAGQMPASAARKTISVNETEGSIKSVGTLESTAFYKLNGKFSNLPADSKDEFSFTVKQTGNYTLRFDPLRGTINKGKITLLQVGRGVRTIGSAGISQNLTRSLQAGSYRLRLEGQSSNGFTSYQANIVTPKPTSRTIILNIDKAEALDTFDSGTSTQRKADFYVQSRINGTSKPKTKVIGNNNTPTFNHRVTQTVPVNLDVIPLTVVLRDEDRLSKDDLADINPSSKNRGINIKYFPATGKIVNGSDNTVINTGSSFFTIQGKSGPKAKLRLRIIHSNQ